MRVTGLFASLKLIDSRLSARLVNNFVAKISEQFWAAGPIHYHGLRTRLT
jgi:hypothetical protein